MPIKGVYLLSTQKDGRNASRAIRPSFCIQATSYNITTSMILY